MTAEPSAPDRSPPDLEPPDRLDTATCQRLRAAADLAVRRYPGAIGELLRQELLSWMVFGLHLGSALIMRVADDLIAGGDQIAPASDREATPRGGNPGRSDGVPDA